MAPMKCRDYNLVVTNNFSIASYVSKRRVGFDGNSGTNNYYLRTHGGC
jgi:hypothetical protein